MKATFNLLPDDWGRLKEDLQILRLCPTNPVEINVKLSRMYKKINNALSGLGLQMNRRREELLAELQKEQGVDDIQQINWTPADQQKIQGLQNEIFGQPLALELNKLTSKDFPNLLAPNGMGVRTFLKEDRSGRVFNGETHFLDHYLNLLGELIEDLEEDEEVKAPGLSVVTDDTTES